MERKKILTQHYFRFITASMLVGLACALLAFTLKYLTEYFERHLFKFIQGKYSALFIVLPTIGITALFF
ncbi:hypothetical protein [Chryseobacterium sp. MP_3.2]|uniref:hypothetical protein n=1 Tax=Chryseobacterium sp. MP_3.2 TaxID=3071712 RepID=UPI002E1171AB